MINNWTPETASLIATLKRHGFEIVRGSNGEERFTLQPGRDGMKKFIENLIACDEARMWVKDPQDGKERCLFLVLGNSPGELVCDYSVSDRLDKATEEHYDRWESRKQPKWTAAEAYPQIYGPAAIAEKEAAYAKRQAEQEAHIRQIEGK